MAKSYTKRKFAEVNQVKMVAEAASTYVRHWTQQEARKLLKQEILIIPASWGFQVGKYAVKTTQQGWRVEDPAGELINNFTSKRSAVSWCVLYQTNRFQISERLLTQDIRLSKLVQDQTNYTYNKQQARKKSDYFTVDVLAARLAETEGFLDLAKIDLEKTLNSAKYLKGIWEKPL